MPSSGAHDHRDGHRSQERKPLIDGPDASQMWALREEVKELLPAELYPMMDEIIDK